MAVTRETVIKALDCCVKQTLEACERCPLQECCRDGKTLLLACRTLLKATREEVRL